MKKQLSYQETSLSANGKLISSPAFQRGNQQFLPNLLMLLSGALLSQGVATVILLLTARYLGSEKYGQYTACLTLTGFAAIAVNLGAEIWLLRIGSEGVESLGEHIGSVLVVKILLGALWLGIIFVIASLLNPAVFPPNLLMLSAFFSWLNSLFATILAGCKASLRNKFTLFLQAIYTVLWFVLTAIILINKDQNPENYVAVRLIALFLAFVVGLFTINGISPLKASFSMIFKIIRETPPFALSELMAWAYMRIDVLVISFALGHQAVGVYSAAENIVNALFFIPAAVYEVTVPLLNPLLLSDFKYISKYLSPFKAAGFLLFIAVMLIAAILGRFLGPGFEESVWVLLILSPIPLLHSLVFGFTSIIVAAGKQRERVWVQSGTVIINIILSIATACYFGIKWVAAAYTITEIMLLLGYMQIVRKYVGHSLQPSNLING